MDESASALERTLRQIGPRLQALRARRGLTLAEVASATGISKSTLSRLETGQRRASLELMLPLAREYRVPLDDLVGAPETGDPRVRLRPRRVNGRTVVALTRQPGERHAWKIVVPRTSREPSLTSHEGSSWMYVLSGRIRLIVGDRDVLLESGEVAEFDTRIPHWFGADGEQDAEILTIFGTQAGHGHRSAELATRHLAEVLGESGPTGAVSADGIPVGE
ncbi:HTH-type transcriptional regulator SutR [Microbacterium oxydans]|uniref:Anaerobic benzoate catabolism transcriptional regulator n=1 Tax=Microbacterium oxydans TaxID=82380 RepID=A0A0F0LAB5_9MICO|nr:XRE family transcriptional regulator [Microbacterium oxydans]KJL29205.1 anaerobic benzoate catabolism transcriptional regulator [Microbacterium oxydans]CAH0191109.1 HTH-type transcriptional regulator SutR [Microbacterium oxydans]